MKQQPHNHWDHWIHRLQCDNLHLYQALQWGGFPVWLQRWYGMEVAHHAFRLVRDAGALTDTTEDNLRDLLHRMRQHILSGVPASFEDETGLLLEHTQETLSDENYLAYWMCYAIDCATEDQTLEDVPGWPDSLDDEAIDLEAIEYWQRRRLIYLLQILNEYPSPRDFFAFITADHQRIEHWENPQGAMAAISLKAPHFTLIADGHKTIEGRKQNSHYRGPVVILASRTQDQDVSEHIHLYQGEGDPDQHPWVEPLLPFLYRFPTGVPVAMAQLINSRPMRPQDLPKACYPYDWEFQHLKSLVLADVRPITGGVPVTGQLGVFAFDWSDDMGTVASYSSSQLPD